MVPPAPPRLSITTGWPRLSCSFWPSTRPTMSVPPPGGYGTTRRIGRVGKGSAARAAAGNIAAPPRRVKKSRRRIGHLERRGPRWVGAKAYHVASQSVLLRRPAWRSALGQTRSLRRSVGGEAAAGDEHAQGVDRGKPMPARERDDQIALSL